jgi:hypothetical protein
MIMGAGVTVALEVLFGLLDRAQAIGTLLAQARSEGRDITQAELDALFPSGVPQRYSPEQQYADSLNRPQTTVPQSTMQYYGSANDFVPEKSSNIYCKL